MNNCICTDSGDCIGFYADLKRGLELQACEFTKSKDYDMAKESIELLEELEKYDCDSLLIMSENNGMGYTIRLYEKGGA